MGYIYRRKKKLGDGTKVEVGPYWIKYYRSGLPYRESAGSVKESDAKRLLRLREGDIAKGIAITPKMGKVTIDELLEDVKNDYRMNGKSSIRTLQMRCDKHLLPFFGGRKAASISTADVREFIVMRQAGRASAEEIERELTTLQENHAAAVSAIQRAGLRGRELRKRLGLAKRSWLQAVSEAKRKAGATNGEIHRELATLKRAFNLGLQSKKIMEKPHLPMLEENSVRQGFFEPEAFKVILAHLAEHVRPVIRFAYITGWRTLSEILPLEWRQVDFRSGRVRLDPGTTKNRDGREFPFTHELRALLEEQKAKNEILQKEQGILSPYVFTYEGKPFKSYKRSWATACRKCGLTGKIPHDFRRTTVTNLVRAGIPERVAMQMTGHKTRSVFERYNIVSQGDLLDAARRLDSFTVENSDSIKAHDA